jgi:hypothetical protein
VAIDWWRLAREGDFDDPKAMLEALYITSGWTMAQIADVHGCSSFAVRDALIRFGIPLKQHGGHRGPRPDTKERNMTDPPRRKSDEQE